MIIFKEKIVTDGTEKKEQNMMENFKKVFKLKDVWLLSFFYGLIMAGMMSIITFLPISLEERGIDRGGELVAILLATSVVFNIMGGVLSDKAGRRKPFLSICAVILGISFMTLNTFSGISLIIMLVIAGAAMGTIAPVLMTIPVELEEIGHGLAATAMGLIFMIGNTGGFVGPVITGKLMDITGSHTAGFIFMMVALIIAAGFVLPLRETGRKMKKEKVVKTEESVN